MDISTFTWSVIAGIIATILVGTTITMKIINRNKSKTNNNLKQSGSNHTAFQNSTINYNSPQIKKEEDK